MKKNLLLALFGLYGMTAFGVADTRGLHCTPTYGYGPAYDVSETSGGAPGFPVDFLHVSRTDGNGTVTANIDLLKDQATKFVRAVGPTQVGSALVQTYTFATYNPVTRQTTNTGYINIYTRTSIPSSLIDVQLPSDVVNAAAVNTTPPLTNYTCTTFIH